MEIDIKDLQLGDTVLTVKGSKLLAITLLRVPAISSTLDWMSRKKYKSIKCSYKEIITEVSYGLSEHGHNKEGYFNLNGKTFYLLKRGSHGL